MAKRGEKQPWKVRYEWTTGAKGVASFSSEDSAQMKADEIRLAGERWDDKDVTVTVQRVDS